MPKQKDALFIELRRQKICDLVREQGTVSVNMLSKHFSVSSGTIRTDLDFLEDRGMLKRTHGGAIYLQTIDYELTTQEKMTQNTLEKSTIASAALQFVHPGDVIAIDTGTTGFEFAKQLVGLSNLTVVTNDILIASFLEQNTDFSVLILGGIIRKQFHYTVGNSVLDTLDSFHIDTFFLSTNGISLERGLSTHNTEIANIKSKMIDVSGNVVLLADKTKFDRDAFVFFAPLEKIDVIVTNAEFSNKIQEISSLQHIQYVHVEI